MTAVLDSLGGTADWKREGESQPLAHKTLTFDEGEENETVKYDAQLQRDETLENCLKRLGMTKDRATRMPLTRRRSDMRRKQHARRPVLYRGPLLLQRPALQIQDLDLPALPSGEGTGVRTT